MFAIIPECISSDTEMLMMRELTLLTHRMICLSYFLSVRVLTQKMLMIQTLKMLMMRELILLTQKMLMIHTLKMLIMRELILLTHRMICLSYFLSV